MVGLSRSRVCSQLAIVALITGYLFLKSTLGSILGYGFTICLMLHCIILMPGSTPAPMFVSLCMLHIVNLPFHVAAKLSKLFVWEAMHGI